ncbi:MAG TPA: hypothetical protein VGM23_11020, partial [Armatimonadota bacterium]
MPIRIRLLFAFCCLGLAVMMAGAQQASVAKPAVLFILPNNVDGDNQYAYQYLRDVAAAGLAIDRCVFEELRWERLAKFNVLVFMDTSSVVTGKLDAAGMAKLDVIHRFLAAGGGVMFVPTNDQQPIAVPRFWYLLDRYGAELQVGGIDDKSHRQTHSLRNIPYAYTENIARDTPLTRDVPKGIWYPVSFPGAELIMSNVMTCRFSPEWTVLARGSDSSRYYPLPTADAAVNARLPKEGITGGVPIYAVRQVEKGRICFNGIHPAYTFYGGYAPTQARVALSAGLDGLPSGLGKLMLNTYRWLAEPSLGGTELGGANPAPERLLAKNPWPTAPPMNWENPSYFPGWQKSFRGMLGARSAISGGKGSVKEWAAAARAAGLSFLGFAEDFAQLTPQKVEQLNADCAANSADDLQLIPGYLIKDDFGNTYYVVRKTAVFPGAAILDAQNHLHNNLTEPTAIGSLHFYLSFGPQLVATVMHATNPNPYWDFRAYNAVVVYTTRNGKPVDSLHDGYLQLLRCGMRLVPLALNLMENPAALKIPGEAFFTYFWTDSPRAVADALDDTAAYGGRAHTYLTQGPIIDTWQMANRDYAKMGEWYGYPYYRCQVRFATHSDVGLKEVRVWDGPTLCRRFLPGGAKEFARTLIFTHQQQHALLIEVLDNNGRRAISAFFQDRSLLDSDTFCGDRMNVLGGSIQRAPNELGWITLMAHPGIAHGPMTGSVWFPTNLDMMASPGFDGWPEGMPSITYAPEVQAKQGREGGATCVNWLDRPLASADVIVRQTTLTTHYAPGVPIWNTYHSFQQPQENALFTGRVRYFATNYAYRKMMAVLVEGEVTAKRDLDFGPDQGITFANLITHPHSEYGVAMCKSADGTARSMALGRTPSPAPYRFTPGVGGYVSYFPSAHGSATVVNLTPGCEVVFLPGRVNYAFFNIPLAGKSLKAGETVRYRFLALSGPYGEAADSGMVDTFV